MQEGSKTSNEYEEKNKPTGQEESSEEDNISMSSMMVARAAVGFGDSEDEAVVRHLSGSDSVVWESPYHSCSESNTGQWTPSALSVTYKTAQDSHVSATEGMLHHLPHTFAAAACHLGKIPRQPEVTSCAQGPKICRHTSPGLFNFKRGTRSQETMLHEALGSLRYSLAEELMLIAGVIMQQGKHQRRFLRKFIQFHSQSYKELVEEIINCLLEAIILSQSGMLTLSTGTFSYLLTPKLDDIYLGASMGSLFSQTQGPQINRCPHCILSNYSSAFSKYSQPPRGTSTEAELSSKKGRK
ncbi:hypothetical protein NDU88_006722 [Pleurodeles waltl]|uniref:Uncharacterized protein n=1 Tax=Pleurodeles waltl TaxID=8319 RepID=A0AAV7SQG2_PLEWA|nr:hypothetical protein NDU88_006722 [Pleurodeles waltl]